MTVRPDVTPLPRDLGAFLRDKRVRDLAYQILVVVALAALVFFFVRNASQNMVRAGIAAGFDFLWRMSGIDVPFVLTGYKPSDTILSLLWAGVANTLLVTGVAIVLSTLLGFVIGIARLSTNWLLSSLAGAYVEFVRNIPLLLFVLFWYFGVIASLPGPRQSISLFAVAFLNNRGMTIPIPLEVRALQVALAVLVAGLIAQALLAFWARRRQARTGRAFPVWAAAALLVGLVPTMALTLAVLMTAWEVPTLRGFNYRGGFVLIPEFVALVLALTTYTAGFVAEIVRGGIMAISKGQTEAAMSLGLKPWQVMRLVTIPLALRVMIPPMTSQYLNVLKNSSFGAAIAYPDLVSLFMGSALNNTGQAVEIVAITLAIYLAIGLVVSAFMNWYNARVALVVR